MSNEETITIPSEVAKAIIDWWRGANEAPGGCSAQAAIDGMSEAIWKLEQARRTQAPTEFEQEHMTCQYCGHPRHWETCDHVTHPDMGGDHQRCGCERPILTQTLGSQDA